MSSQAARNAQSVNRIDALEQGGGGTTDHSALTNRDAINSHPKSAIAGLEDDLTQINQSLATKVDAVAGKGLSTNDFTITDKAKLDGLTQGEVNTASNIGLSGVGLFQSKQGTNLQFKKIVVTGAGSITEQAETVTINVPSGGGGEAPVNHNELLNRDATDCHPQSAVTGLVDALSVLTAGQVVATQAETLAGSDNTKKMTPLQVKLALEARGMWNNAIGAPSTDLNNITTTGEFLTESSGLVNLPTGWPQVRYLLHVIGGSTYAVQILVNVSSSGNNGGEVCNMAIRRMRSAGVWSDWFTVWHGNNFNPATKEDVGVAAALLADVSGSAGIKGKATTSCVFDSNEYKELELYGKEFRQLTDLVTTNRSADAYVNTPLGEVLVTSDMPRIKFDGHGDALGLITEQGKLNHFINSHDLSLSGWTTARATFSGSKLTEDTTTNTHLIYQSASGSGLASNVLSTVSFKVKPDGRDFVVVGLHDASVTSSYIGVAFDIVNGVKYTPFIATGATYYDSKIEYDGDGYWLVSVSGIPSANANSAQGRLTLAQSSSASGYLGDGTSGVLIKRAQIELGGMATQGIVSGATAGIRPAEANKFTVPLRSNFSLYIKLNEVTTSELAPHIFALRNSVGSEYLRLYKASATSVPTTNFRLQIAAPAAVIVTNSVPYDVGALVLTCNNGKLSLHCDGVAVVTDFAIANVAFDELFLGTWVTNVQQLNAAIGEYHYFAQPLVAADALLLSKGI